MVSLVVSAGVAALGTLWGPLFGGWEALAHALNALVGFGVSTVLFAMIYKLMPRAKVGWRDVWVGAAFTSLLFTIGRFLIGLYLGKSGVTSGFGAAGSLVLVMVWVYYSAQIFLLGAEFTWVYAHAWGSRRGETRPRAEPSGADRQARSPREPLAGRTPPVATASGPSASETRRAPKARPFAVMAAAAGAGLVMAFVTRGRARRRSPRPAGAGSAA
jgi:membrane protein